jgi:hypothetical protein
MALNVVDWHAKPETTDGLMPPLQATRIAIYVHVLIMLVHNQFRAIVTSYKYLLTQILSTNLLRAKLRDR